MKEKHDLQFKAFHRDNPNVYEELVRLARLGKSRGLNRIGIKMLWEVTRWNLMIHIVRKEGEYKLNNNYHSRYARLIMRQEPDLVDIFETRRLRTVVEPDEPKEPPVRTWTLHSMFGRPRGS